MRLVEDEHTHPLFDALGQGSCSFEADTHLVNGKLLVAHDRKNVDPGRMLESLYLKRMIWRDFGGSMAGGRWVIPSD